MRTAYTPLPKSTDTASLDPLTARTRALELAARAECDVRTAARALRDGPDVIHTIAVRERLRRAMGAR
jgi:hypothetical protein